MDQQQSTEVLLAKFEFQKRLNQDQNGRRLTLLGRIDASPALLTIERSAFPSDDASARSVQKALKSVEILGHNDIYHWYLATTTSFSESEAPPDLKVNLIWPCTQKHIQKYSPQDLRYVTETSEIYKSAVRPYMQRMRESGRLDWVFNIIEGRAEQEDIIHRQSGAEDGFLLTPDLNWDRKTLESLHLLVLVERRDIWSLRDLQRSHLPWLTHLREQVVKATLRLYPGLESDQLKLYVHYQPTYYHFHIHLVHVRSEPTATQAVGKAIGLDTIMAMLSLLPEIEAEENMPVASLADLTLSYHLGSAHDLWTNVFLPLKDTGTRTEVET